jgi:hypothetical protein
MQLRRENRVRFSGQPIFEATIYDYMPITRYLVFSIEICAHSIFDTCLNSMRIKILHRYDSIAVFGDFAL